MSKARLARRYIGTFAALSGIGAAAYGVYALVQWRFVSAAAGAWTNARSCLIGAPLEPDETAVERLARVDWSDEKSSGPKQELLWPNRCLPALQVLSQQAVLPRAAAGPVRALLDSLKPPEQPEKIAYATPLRADLVASLVAAIGPLERGAPIPSFVTAPHLAPRPLITPDALAAYAERFIGISTVYWNGIDAQAPDSVALSGVRDGGCRIKDAPEHPLSELTCGHERANHQGFRLDDGRRLQLARSTEKTLELFLSAERRPLGPVATLTKSTRGDAIIGDNVVWCDGTALRARHLSRLSPDPGPESTLAPLATDCHFHSCRAGDENVLVVSAKYSRWSNGEDLRRDNQLDGNLLFFEKGGVWSPPIEVPAPKLEGEGARRGTIGPPTLACAPDEARIAYDHVSWPTDIDEHEFVSVVCHRAGCVESKYPIGTLGALRLYELDGGHPIAASVALVVDLGGSMAAVWPRLHAFFGRVAPFDRLALAPDVLLAGNGAELRISDPIDMTFTRDSTALFFLGVYVRSGRYDGLLPFRVDKTGTFTAFPPPP
jgi:hypothetical protein